MKRIMIAAGAAALLAASSLTALGEEANGAIQSIDLEARTVTLADGTTYMLPEGFDLSALQVGMNVKIEFNPTPEGPNAATAVEPAA